MQTVELLYCIIQEIVKRKVCMYSVQVQFFLPNISDWLNPDTEPMDTEPIVQLCLTSEFLAYCIERAEV